MPLGAASDHEISKDEGVTLKRLVVVALLGGFGGPVALAEEATSLKEALGKGEFAVNFRYRFENVNDDAFDKEANASTLRTTLSYRTKPYNGFSLFLEAEDVTDIGTDGQYNNAGAGSLNNGVTDRPVIADPEVTEINQAYLRIAVGKTTLDLGRQEMLLGDQRYVGNVGWRQNHQSFDVLSLISGSLSEVTFTYAFIDNVNGIFGDNKPMASHVLNAGIGLPFGNLNVYGLWLDFDRLEDARFSTSTFGAELTGEHDLGGGSKILWEAEYATQQDIGNNPSRVDVGYSYLLLGGILRGITLVAGFEVLEGSEEDGQFSTPLATLHKWNGWADKFLLTPVDGLEDLYFHVGGAAGGLNWMAVYHDFSAESGDLDYGTEVDLLLTYRTSWEQLFGVKAAFYDADQFSTNTDKVWFWTSYRF